MKFTRIKWLSLFLTLVMLTACTVVAPQPATNTESPAPAMQPTPEPTALPAPEPTAEPAPETSTSGTASPVVGRWVGQISVAGQILDMVVKFAEQDGVLSGDIDVPQQGGVPFNSVTYNAPQIDFSMLPSPQTATFSGQMIDTDTITGTFSQAGYEGTFDLARAAEVAAPPVPYAEEEVIFQNGEITWVGTRSLPEGDGPFPAVVLISGSGAQDRNETVFGFEVFRTLADALTRNGVAVLRYDDRGVGGSTGGSPDDTSADFAEDVLAGVEMLGQRSEIDPAHIGLLGHSEGGIIAPMAANQSDKVAFVILMAGPSLPGEEILDAQLHLILAADGATPDQIDQASARQQQTLSAVRTGEGWDQLEADVRAELQVSIDELPEAQRAQIPDVPAYIDGVVASQLGAVRGAWFSFFVTYDPAPALESLTVPMLALYGGKDLQVPADGNEAALQAIIDGSSNPAMTIKSFPTANHLFQEATTGSPTEYGDLEKAFVSDFLDTITQWIQAHSQTQ